MGKGNFSRFRNSAAVKVTNKWHNSQNLERWNKALTYFFTFKRYYLMALFAQINVKIFKKIQIRVNLL